MQIEQKPVELLQAQIAVYAKSQVEREAPERTGELLSQLGDVAFYTNYAPDHVNYARKHNKKSFVDGEIVVTEAVGSPLPLFDKKEYADFLKDPTTREQSRNLAKMSRTYDKLAPKITGMDIQDISYKDAGEHPNILGRGSNKAAFAFRAEVDGVEKDLVALVDHAPDKSYAKAKLLERASNLALVKGRAGFEQGVAWSNDPPVVVAERAYGVSLEELSSEQANNILPEHWQKLATNVEAVANLGIALDPMLSNFYYDPKEGFTVIDFRRSVPGKEKTTLDLNLKQIDEIRSQIIAQARVRV